VYHGRAVAPVLTRLRPIAAIVAIGGLTFAGGWMLVRSVQDGWSGEAINAPPDAAPPAAMAVDRAVHEFAIAPDGQRLAFSAADADGTRRLWVRSTGAVDERPLPDTDGAAYPFWSPDSRFIAYFAGGALRTVAADGGMPAVITAAAAAAGGAWHGEEILFAMGPLYRVPAGGGTATAITRLRDGESAHASPVFLPDGQRFLYTVTQSGAEPRVRVGSLTSMEPRDVLSNAADVALADGYIVYIRDRALHVQPFDIALLTPRGDAFLVSDGAPSRPGGDGVRAFSLSGAGILAYQTGAGNIGSPVTLVDWRTTAQR
jgi:hypothetical protein